MALRRLVDIARTLSDVRTLISSILPRLNDLIVILLLEFLDPILGKISEEAGHRKICIHCFVQECLKKFHLFSIILLSHLEVIAEVFRTTCGKFWFNGCCTENFSLWLTWSCCSLWCRRKLATSVIAICERIEV